MIELNESGKYKWKITYTTGTTELISGSHYDFVPNRGDLIVLDDKIYSVTLVAYDFDTTTIRVELGYLKDVYPDVQEDL